MKYYFYIIIFFSLSACTEKANNGSPELEVKEKMNNASTKLKILDLYAEDIYALNKNIQTKFNSDSAALLMFINIDDTLKLIRDELIATSGGVTRLGEYANPPAEKEVNEYFYGKTKYRNNAQAYFFESLTGFDAQLKKNYPNSQFLEKLDKRFNILMKPYGLESKEMVFKYFNISEAVALIESIRSHIAIEQTEYLLLN